MMDYFNQVSDRLYFRRVAPSDILSWESFFINNDGLKFLGVDLSKGPTVLSEEWIHNQLLRYKKEGYGLLAVIEKSSQLLIGMGGIIPREVDGTKDYEIAYSLKPEYWGKGYGTEIALKIKDFGRESQLSQRFISIIDKANLRSIRVAEKNGMSIERETTFLGLDVFIYTISILY